MDSFDRIYTGGRRLAIRLKMCDNHSVRGDDPGAPLLKFCIALGAII